MRGEGDVVAAGMVEDGVVVVDQLEGDEVTRS
jgi:hypothetical protein